MAYRGKQDLEHAKRDLETALKLDPRRAKSKEALDEVNRLIERAAPPAAAAPTIPAAPATLGASHRLIVVAVGFALIAFAIWLFWLKRATGVSAIGVGGGYQDATVLVKRGYTPDTLVARYEKAVGRDLRKEKEKRAVPDFPHGRSADEVLGALGVSVATGLSEEEAERRLNLYGLNTIIARHESQNTRHPCPSVSKSRGRAARRSGGNAFYFGELEEGSAIVGVLALNTLIGFVTEIRGRALDPGAPSARNAPSEGVPRRAHAPHSGRAPCARRHCPPRGRRCGLGGPADRGSVEPRSGRVHVHRGIGGRQ